MKKFQNFFFRTPLVNVFILGSEVYHDYYRWPARDRRTFEGWLEKTEWGKLFVQYAKQGVFGARGALKQRILVPPEFVRKPPDRNRRDRAGFVFRNGSLPGSRSAEKPYERTFFSTDTLTGCVRVTFISFPDSITRSAPLVAAAQTPPARVPPAAPFKAPSSLRGRLPGHRHRRRRRRPSRCHPSSSSSP